MPTIRDLVLAVSEIGKQCLAKGRWPESYLNTMLAAELLEHLNDSRLLAQVLEAKADALRRMRRHEEAIAELRRALLAARTCGDRELEIGITYRLGVEYAKTGRRELGYATLRSAADLAAEELPRGHRLERWRRLLRPVEGSAAPGAAPRAVC